MIETMTNTAVLVALFIIVTAALYALWLRWQSSNDAERRRLLAEAVHRLVDAAEQKFKEPGSGSNKFSWVIGRLTKRFPGVDWDTLAEHIEQAVHQLNASRAARQRDRA